MYIHIHTHTYTYIHIHTRTYTYIQEGRGPVLHRTNYRRGGVQYSTGLITGGRGPVNSTGNWDVMSCVHSHFHTHNWLLPRHLLIIKLQL